MILGITGTNGSGKGTVVEYLQSKGFKHYSARAFIAEEIERRGLPLERPSYQKTADSLRKEHGPGYIIEQLVLRAQAVGGDAAIESIRALGEAHFLHEHGAKLVAVNADQKLRYERTVERGSHTDNVDFETWVAQEEAEWHNEAAHEMDVPGVMALADATIMNNGSLEDLQAQVDAVLRELTK